MKNLTVQVTNSANCQQDLSVQLPKALQTAIYDASKMRRLEDIVARRSEPKLAVLNNDFGEVRMMSVIMAFLAQMDRNMHVRNGLTEDNVRDIAKRLMSDRDVTHWLTLADIKLLCRNIEDGVYGKFSYRFGKNDFYECFRLYCASRNQIHEYNATHEYDHDEPEEKTVEEILEESKLLAPLKCLIVSDKYEETSAHAKKNKIYKLAKALHLSTGMDYQDAIRETERRVSCSK